MNLEPRETIQTGITPTLPPDFAERVLARAELDQKRARTLRVSMGVVVCLCLLGLLVPVRGHQARIPAQLASNDRSNPVAGDRTDTRDREGDDPVDYFFPDARSAESD